MLLKTERVMSLPRLIPVEPTYNAAEIGPYNEYVACLQGNNSFKQEYKHNSADYHDYLLAQEKQRVSSPKQYELMRISRAQTRMRVKKSCKGKVADDGKTLYCDAHIQNTTKVTDNNDDYKSTPISSSDSHEEIEKLSEEQMETKKIAFNMLREEQEQKKTSHVLLETTRRLEKQLKENESTASHFESTPEAQARRMDEIAFEQQRQSDVLEQLLRQHSV